MPFSGAACPKSAKSLRPSAIFIMGRELQNAQLGELAGLAGVSISEPKFPNRNFRTEISEPKFPNGHFGSEKNVDVSAGARSLRLSAIFIMGRGLQSAQLAGASGS